MTGLTYPQFHAAFVLPALLLLAATTAVARRRSTRRTVWVRGGALVYWADVALLVGLAIAYTTPWDNYLIAEGVWEYGPGTTLARLGYAPVSEYVFFGAQTVLTGLWLSQLPAGRNPTTPSERSMRARHAERVVAVAAAVGLFLVGWRLLATESTFYLGAILAWGAPVLGLQWGVGAPALRDRWHTVVLGVGVPTLYLSVVDRIAIGQGVWELSAAHTTGVTIAGLPVEEALFFLTTNLFVVQGLILARWVRDRWA